MAYNVIGFLSASAKRVQARFNSAIHTAQSRGKPQQTAEKRANDIIEHLETLASQKIQSTNQSFGNRHNMPLQSGCTYSSPAFRVQYFPTSNEVWGLTVEYNPQAERINFELVDYRQMKDGNDKPRISVVNSFSVWSNTDAMGNALLHVLEQNLEARHRLLQDDAPELTQAA